MGFSRMPFIAALAVAASAFGMGAVAASSASIEVAQFGQSARTTKPQRQRKGHAPGTVGWKRSRGAQAKPKKRPNMRTVSKRVRRKHRRAA